jgi:hypothetical protein
MADGPIRLDETTRAAVSSGRLVHLATIAPDGTPQVTSSTLAGTGTRSSPGILPTT